MCGAFTNTCPKEYAPQVAPVVNKERTLIGAFGHEAKHYGQKVVNSRVLTAAGRRTNMSVAYEVTNVGRPLISVSKGNDDEKSFWFTPDQGCGFARSKDVQIVIRGDYIPLYRNKSL